MKTIIFLLFLFKVLSLNAQDSTQVTVMFKQISIGSSGLVINVPEAFDKKNIGKSTSPDNSLVYSFDQEINGFHYTGIVIELKETTVDNNEQLLRSYLDYLKETYSIDVATSTSNKSDQQNVTGIGEYWEDMDNQLWSVQSWTNGKQIVVLGIYGTTEYPNYIKSREYLEGVRF